LIEVVTIETPELGDRSYIVHDGSEALVVDPQRDIDRCTEAAERLGVKITAVAESHIHNDYVSGGLALATMAGARYVVAAADEVGFERVGVQDHDIVTVASFTVEVLSTPGHTPNHCSYLIKEGDHPVALCTGGSLLYGTVGRTDLIGTDVTEELTRAQYRSAQRLAHLPEDVGVYPTHGFGSFCSSTAPSGSTTSTIGQERQMNLALTIDDEDTFVKTLLAGLTAYPRYYVHMGAENRRGAAPVDLSPPEPVDTDELRRRIEAGEWVVDLRARRAFARGHISGTIGIELGDLFSTYLGWLIPWGTPVTLLGETPDAVAKAQRDLVRIGIDRPAGSAVGAIDELAGGSPLGSYPCIDFATLARERSTHPDLLILDVRRDDERLDAHLPSSIHIPLQDLGERMEEIPAGRGPLFVHCAAGFRAALAASLLDRSGYEVVLVDDDFAVALALGVAPTLERGHAGDKAP